MDQDQEVPALELRPKGKPEKIMARFYELLEAEGLELTPKWETVFTCYTSAAVEFFPAGDDD